MSQHMQEAVAAFFLVYTIALLCWHAKVVYASDTREQRYRIELYEARREIDRLEKGLQGACKELAHWQGLDLIIPNLDDIDPAERERFRGLFDLLENYCSYKQYASHYRLEGNIEAALGYEKACETIYRRLPKELRW